MSVSFNRPFVPEDHQSEMVSTLIPEGEYVFRCTDSEKKKAKAGHDMLILHFEVAHGDKKGLSALVFLNLWHDTEKTRDIAASELAQICTSMGLTRITDTDDMHDKLLACTIIHEVSGEWTNMRFRNWRPAPPAEKSDNDGMPF